MENLRYHQKSAKITIIIIDSSKFTIHRSVEASSWARASAARASRSARVAGWSATVAATPSGSPPSSWPVRHGARGTDRGWIGGGKVVDMDGNRWKMGGLECWMLDEGFKYTSEAAAMK